MELQADFYELLGLLNGREVDYLIVGGYALAFHGSPRFTGDLDILINPEPDNARRLLDALNEFGFGSAGLSIDDFTSQDSVVQLGVAPVRVDILTSLTGVSWREAFTDHVKGMYGDINTRVIGRRQLIANKRALGRKRDLADLEALGEII